MSNMQPVGAGELAGAVARYLKSAHVYRQCGYELIDVFREAKRVGATAWTGTVDLDQIRWNLCFTCRAHGLYQCDVAKGWSSNCAFIQSNV